jgi:uncharacterized protein YjbI with pentapeptide repeats
MDTTFQGKFTLMIARSHHSKLNIFVDPDNQYTLTAMTGISSGPAGLEGVFALFASGDSPIVNNDGGAGAPIAFSADINGKYLVASGNSIIASGGPNDYRFAFCGSIPAQMLWRPDAVCSNQGSQMWGAYPGDPIFEQNYFYYGGDPYTLVEMTSITPGMSTLLTTAVLDGMNLVYVDLSEAVFSGKSLKGANLSYAVLSGTKFIGCDLTGANLTGATFDINTDFSNAILLGTTFNDCDLSAPPVFNAPVFWDPNSAYAQANGLNCPPLFQGATVPFSIFELNCSYVDLTGANIVDIPTTICNTLGYPNNVPATAAFLANHTRFPIGLKLSNCILVGAQFDFAVLDGVILQYANLHQAAFQSASLVGTDLSGTDLSGCNMDGATLSQTTGVVTTDAKLIDAYMIDAILTNTTLDGADFTGAHFYGDNAMVSGKTSMIGTDFSKAVLTNLDFSGATLNQTAFNNAQMINCNFADANLSAVKFEGAYLQGADFSLAALVENVSFEGAVFSLGPGQVTIPNNNQNAGWTVTWGATQPNSDQFGHNCTLPDGSLGKITSQGQLIGPFKFTDPGLTNALSGISTEPEAVPPLLQQIFSNHQVILSSAAQVSILSSAAGNEAWFIDDDPNQQTYTLLTENEVISVYGMNQSTPYPPVPACVPGSSEQRCQPPNIGGL